MKNLSKKIIICLFIITFSFLFVSCKKEKTYTITYNLNGGKFESNVITTFTNQTIPNELPMPIKADYNFISWVYNGKDVTDFSFIGKETNIELDAKWEKIKPYVSNNCLSIGDEATLYAPGHYDDTNLNIEINSDVITIDKWLNIVAIKEGTATIKVSEKNNPGDITTITIEVISKKPIISVVSDQTNISGIIKFDISNFDELAEKDLHDFIWTISDSSVATINNNFEIVGLNIGEFKLIATSIYDERVTSYIDLEIVDENEKVVLSTENNRNVYKQGEIFELSILGDQANNKFTWSGSDSNIIRIGENGEIIAVSPGVASISVFENGNAHNRTYYKFTVVENDKDIDYIGNLLTRAFSQVGYKEGPANNEQKYGEWYGNPKEPWCAMFVSWCWYFTGISNDILLKYQGCGTGQDWCIKQGIFHYKKDYTPKPGDIIFFTSAGMGHTGICAYVEGDYMYTIEGNSSNKVGIWRWSLKDARITGYASPNYPEFEGTVKDFSFLAGKDESGEYYWTNVSEKQDVE